MTLLELYNKVKSINGSLNSADVPLKCNGNDFNVDFEIKSKDAIVSHIEVKQDLALTLEDVAYIVDTFYVAEGNTKEKCEEVLKRFNEKKEKY